MIDMSASIPDPDYYLKKQILAETAPTNPDGTPVNPEDYPTEKSVQPVPIRSTERLSVQPANQPISKVPAPQYPPVTPEKQINPEDRPAQLNQSGDGYRPEQNIPGAPIKDSRLVSVLPGDQLLDKVPVRETNDLSVQYDRQPIQEVPVQSAKSIQVGSKQNKNLHYPYDESGNPTIAGTPGTSSGSTTTTTAKTQSEWDVTKPYLGLIQKYRPKPDDTDKEVYRKIAKGNAIAEAFRLMIDAIGGSYGSDINKREGPSNAVLQAVDKYMKSKETDKAEQSAWDKLELNAGLNALTTESKQRYDDAKLKEQQGFQAGEKAKDRALALEDRKNQQEFTRGENALNRGLEAGKSKQQKEEFSQTLGFQKHKQADDNAVEWGKIQASRERWQNLYPYGGKKGLYINDTDIEKQINIPDTKKSQVLAYIEKDPLVANQIPVLKMRYGNVGQDATSDFLIADLYPLLSPQTRALIRQFVGEEPQPAQTQAPQSTGPAYSGFPGTMPPYSGAAPQTPTIKTNKGSTIVQVQPPAGQPAPAQPQEQQTQFELTPETSNYISNIYQSPKYTPEIKRSTIYRYLVQQGCPKPDAKKFAEDLYSELTR
jgi:hypothetical protein